MAGTVTPADTTKVPSDEVNLAGQQLALHSALVKKNTGLSNMYLGAHIVLRQTNNPERHIHAAHSLREMIEKLPLYLEISEKKKGPSLKDKCITLKRCWKNKALRSNAHHAGQFKGEIDSFLEAFFKDITEFLKWFDNDNPSRNEERKQLLRELDGYDLPMPNTIEKNRTKQFSDFQNYFTRVSHHNKMVDIGEFDSYLYHFEFFLLDIFVPRTFENHEAIDDVIALGEADD